MPQSQFAAPCPVTPKTSTLQALPAPPPQSLEGPDRETVRLICEVIRLDGLPDHLVAAFVGVSRSTLARWKAENERLAVQLDQARARFVQARMRKIDEARRSDGTPDWRAQAWLIKHAGADPAEKPAPANRDRSTKQPPAAVSKGANLPETPVAPPASPRSVTIRPEITTQRPAPLAGQIAPACENATIRPETHPAAEQLRQRAA